MRIGGNIEDVEILTEYEDVPGAVLYMHNGRWLDNSRNKMPMQKAKDLVSYYETRGYTVRIEDEDGNEVYRSEQWEDMDE